MQEKVFNTIAMAASQEVPHVLPASNRNTVKRAKRDCMMAVVNFSRFLSTPQKIAIIRHLKAYCN